MNLTMRYMSAFPQQELHVIEQMIGSIKGYGGILSDHAEYEAAGENVGNSPDAAETAFAYEEFLSEIDQLSNQLAVLALNSLGEKTLKRISKRDFNIETDRFDHEKIKALFKTNNIDLTKISNYNAFNEVRLVSNSIKHSGVVSKKLSDFYPSYMEGSDINITSADLDKLYLRSKDFLHHICSL